MPERMLLRPGIINPFLPRITSYQPPLIPHFIPTRPTQRKSVPPLFTAMYTSRGDPRVALAGVAL